MEQDETLYDEVATVWELAYLDDGVSAGDVCGAVVTVRTRCGWVMFR